MKTACSWSVALALAALLAAGATASVPAAPPPLPLAPADKHQADSESKQGAQAAADVAKHAKFVTDKAAVARVNAIGQRIAAIANGMVVPAGYGNDHVYPFTWHFYVLEDKDVNAFTLPGGYVYVDTGLLKFVRSDDELAGVLGHEITHAAHHHVAALSHEEGKLNSGMLIGLIAAVLAHVPAQDIANLYQGANLTLTGVANGYGEKAERDADHCGLIYMSRAGYNPVGMLTFMQRLADQEARSPQVELGILRDHPYTTDRVASIETELSEMKVTVTPQTVRQVAGGPRASVHDAADPKEKEILFAGQTLATLNDPAGSRAKAATELLNSLLDNGLQMYQVRVENSTLIADDHPIITWTAADLEAQPNATAAGLAQAAGEALKRGLWAQTINGATASN